jgi:Na+/proline symporter
MDENSGFSIIDYIIFVLVLAISLGIGIYNGCFGKKNTTAKDMLVAGRSMTV